MRCNRDDYRLNRCNVGGQNESVIVAVSHNYSTDKTGGNAPRGLMRMNALIFLIGVGDVKRLCKAVAEIVRSTCLQCFAVVHESFDCVCRLGSCKLVRFGLFTLYNRHCEVTLAEIGIHVKHLFGFVDCFLGSCVNCMTFLPQKFA